MVTRRSPLKIDKQLDCGCHLCVRVYQDRDRDTGERITWNDFARVHVDRRCDGSHREAMEAHTQLLISMIEDAYNKCSECSSDLRVYNHKMDCSQGR